VLSDSTVTSTKSFNHQRSIQTLSQRNFTRVKKEMDKIFRFRTPKNKHFKHKWNKETIHSTLWPSSKMNRELESKEESCRRLAQMSRSKVAELRVKANRIWVRRCKWIRLYKMSKLVKESFRSIQCLITMLIKIS